MSWVYAKPSPVFNVAQVDGYERAESTADGGAIDAIAAADAFVQATGALIHEGGTRAFYRPAEDMIAMPDRARFRGTATEGWYGVLLHELTDWTGAETCLDRTFGERFGDDAYAMEELVAELGAAFLCADLAITPEPRPCRLYRPLAAGHEGRQEGHLHRRERRRQGQRLSRRPSVGRDAGASDRRRVGRPLLEEERNTGAGIEVQTSDFDFVVENPGSLDPRLGIPRDASALVSACARREIKPGRAPATPPARGFRRSRSAAPCPACPRRSSSRHAPNRAAIRLPGGRGQSVCGALPPSGAAYLKPSYRDAAMNMIVQAAERNDAPRPQCPLLVDPPRPALHRGPTPPLPRARRRAWRRHRLHPRRSQFQRNQHARPSRPSCLARRCRHGQDRRGLRRGPRLDQPQPRGHASYLQHLAIP